MTTTSDDQHALLFEQVPETRPEQIVVVDDHDAERLDLSTICCLQHFAHVLTPS